MATKLVEAVEDGLGDVPLPALFAWGGEAFGMIAETVIAVANDDAPLVAFRAVPRP